MIKISSNITIWHKRIFPILLFVGLAVICLFTVWVFHINAIAGLFFLAIIGLPVFVSILVDFLGQCLLYLKLLDEVYYDEKALYIKNHDVEQKIPFSDVLKLKYVWWGTKRIQVTLCDNNKKLYFAVLEPISFLQLKHPKIIEFLETFENYKSLQS